MQKYILLTIFVTTTVFFSTAQQKLIFEDTANQKTVTVKQGSIVKFLYMGYLGQIQTIYGEIELINDSFVRFENNWNVRVSDIMGFRKFSRYRNVIQPTVQIATIVGVIIAVPAVLNNNPQLSSLERLGVTFGIGTLGSLVNSLLFPTRIKRFVNEGWVVRVE